MKYLYYYMWLAQAKVSFKLQKAFYELILFIRNFYFRIKKLDENEIKTRRKRFDKRIKDLNHNNYQFPDGITHWYAFGFLLLMFMVVLFFIPLFTIDYFGKYIINSTLKYVFYNSLLLAVLWYNFYIKKSNKEWLKRKINKKSEEFYLK